MGVSRGVQDAGSPESAKGLCWVGPKTCSRNLIPLSFRQGPLASKGTNRSTSKSVNIPVDMKRNQRWNRSPQSWTLPPSMQQTDSNSSKVAAILDVMRLCILREQRLCTTSAEIGISRFLPPRPLHIKQQNTKRQQEMNHKQNIQKSTIPPRPLTNNTEQQTYNCITLYYIILYYIIAFYYSIRIYSKELDS